MADLSLGMLSHLVFLRVYRVSFICLLSVMGIFLGGVFFIESDLFVHLTLRD